MSHRRIIVLAVAIAAYAAGRMRLPLAGLALFGVAVGLVLQAHLARRGNDRFATAYAALMGAGAALAAWAIEWAA